MNCRDCRGPRGPILRQQWGCDRELAPKEAQHFLDLTILGGARREPVLRCPAVTTPPWVQPVVALFNGYKRGFLPGAGGVLDQGAWCMEAMQVLDRIMAAIAERERE